MGWCSGTEIFDKTVAVVLAMDIGEDNQKRIIRALADAMEDHDWDCQDDSRYYDDPLVSEVFYELHPEWR
jgi:hypothetical protein